MTGQAGDVHSTRQQLKRRAPRQQMNVNQQCGEHSRIRISLSTVTFSGRTCARKVPLYPLQSAEAMLLSAAADLARGVERRRLGCCLLLWRGSWFVWVGYLMTPHNPSHKCPYMVSYTMLNFEALQWITLRNRVCNLSALKLHSMSFKGTFFFAFGGHAFLKTLHIHLGKLFVTCNVLVNNSKTSS